MIFLHVRWIVETSRHPPPSLSSLQDVAEDQSGRRESRLTPSQSGCISVAPPLPFPHLVASPVRMMSLTAVNSFHGNDYHRFGLHFRELSLHSPTPTPPTSPPTFCVPSLPPSLLTPHLMRTEERWVGGGGCGAGAHCCGQEERHGQEGKNNSEKTQSGLVWGGGGVL